MRSIAKVSVCFTFTVFLLNAAFAAQACTEREPTRETGFGPHDFSAGVPEPKLWREGDQGEPLFIRARVIDVCGEPVARARIRIVHANAHGAHESDRWRADLTTDEQGAFDLATVFPGHTGGLPRHIHFIIDHPGHRQLATRLYLWNDPGEYRGEEDLAMVLDEVELEAGRAWLGGYEFVLVPM